MISIAHRIGISVDETQVYEALTTISGLGKWWTEEVVGDSHLGGQITFTFHSPQGELRGRIVMEVIQTNPNHLVAWRCVDGPSDWIGTEVTFSLHHSEGQTIVMFTHNKWPEANEHTAHCSTKWVIFLLSLRDYLETGRGRPAPHDMKIDNWN